MAVSAIADCIINKISVNMLYDNAILRMFLTEENGSIWTIFQDPYTKNNIVKLAKDELCAIEDSLRKEYIESIPYAKFYKGLLLQGYCTSPKFLHSIDNFEIRNSDVFVISYPRSGTTWTEQILSLLYSKNCENSSKMPLYDRVVHFEVGRCVGQKQYLENLNSPRLMATHLPYDRCPKQLRDLNCKVIYIVRNPKDQLVSYYHFHQTAKYLGGKKWDWNSFMHLFENGHLVYGSWSDHVKGWWTVAQKYHERVLFISYEQLHLDIENVAKKIADFIDVPTTDEFIRKLVNHCSFKSMRSNCAVNRTQIPLKNFFDQSQVQFIRKGVVGDWKNYFTEKQSNKFDTLYGELLNEIGLSDAIRKTQTI